MPSTISKSIEDHVKAVEQELRDAGTPTIADAQAAADALGLHFRTLHRMAESGAIRAFRCGTRWRFRRSEIARFIAMQEA